MAYLGGMSKDAFESIIRGAREAIAYMEGDKVGSRTHAVAVEATDVRALRTGLGLTQAEFAALFGVSVHTLRNWEQGRRAPEGPACALLKIIEREPEAALRALAAA